MPKYKLCLLAVSLFICSAVWAKDYSVLDFGAKDDGFTVNTRIIQRAIDAVSERGGGRLVFPTGKYVTGSIYLKSNVTIHFEPGATLLGSNNPCDFVKDKKIGWMSMIFAVNQENIGITGKGIINGRGFITAIIMVSLIHNFIF